MHGKSCNHGSESFTGTKQDIIKLADAIVRGEVFTSWDVREEDHDFMEDIFLPLRIFDTRLIENRLGEKIGLYYSYNSNRIDGKVKDYPCFEHCLTLPESMAEELKKLVDKKKRYYLNYIH